ncbi:MAG TPA: response regulator [Herpetosiphonaceae bacterium]|nr:response regulator [Herpetosiphonaceae bacterium]
MALIMLVEDDLPSRTFMAEALADEGYQTIGADDGVMALEQLATARPDLIITSLMLPRMDGLTFCSHVRDNPATSAIPIVICSATLEAPDPLPGAYAGFLAKPFDLGRFLQLVASHAGP